jgi:hypothetical protein
MCVCRTFSNEAAGLASPWMSAFIWMASRMSAAASSGNLLSSSMFVRAMASCMLMVLARASCFKMPCLLSTFSFSGSSSLGPLCTQDKYSKRAWKNNTKGDRAGGLITDMMFTSKSGAELPGSLGSRSSLYVAETMTLNKQT